MESYNKKYKQKNKRNNNQAKKQYSLDQIIFQPQILLELLESSLNNQKNFILFIKNNIIQFQNTKSNKKINQILIILPGLIKELDLPFASLILEESDLIQFLIELYDSYNEYKKPISLILETIYILFDIIDEYLFVNPMEEWRDYLLDFDIIDENDEYIVNESLTNIQAKFINLSNLYDNWIQYRYMENNIEEENLQYFDECLKIYNDECILLQSDETISPAILEYFHEMILKIENFRNEKFKSGYKYINNELSLEDQINNLNINDYYQNNKINKNEIQKQNIKEILANLRRIPLSQRTFFYKSEKIVEDENLSIEYKDYQFPFGDKQIFEIKRQICGFINSGGGRLYIGITDEKIIKGIVLNKNSLNSFENVLFCCIDNFRPKIQNNKIKIYYIPIKNAEKDSYINNLYIVKLIILPGDPTILYSISPKEFYSTIRLQGQCANLTAEEIHKNILERSKNNIIKNSFNEKDFEDPPPENINNKHNNIEIEDDYCLNSNYPKEMFYSSDRKSKRKNKKNKNRKKEGERGSKIIIKINNIDGNILVKDLKVLFKDSGCTNIQLFQRNGKSKGLGYLYFNDETKADDFIKTFNNCQLGNKFLKCQKKYINQNC